MLIVAAILLALAADMRGCVCDPARPETMRGRECSLAQVAAGQANSAPVFFIQDANPTKPHRWLAIPRAIHRALDDMTPRERDTYWSASIEKARSLWKDQWGIAVNGEERRTQCQMHAHIGKLLEDADLTGGELVDRIEDIPAPPPGAGIWIRPEGAKLRVYVGEMAGELKLMR